MAIGVCEGATTVVEAGGGLLHCWHTTQTPLSVLLMSRPSLSAERKPSRLTQRDSSHVAEQKHWGPGEPKELPDWPMAGGRASVRPPSQPLLHNTQGFPYERGRKKRSNVWLRHVALCLCFSSRPVISGPHMCTATLSNTVVQHVQWLVFFFFAEQT